MLILFEVWSNCIILIDVINVEKLINKWKIFIEFLAGFDHKKQPTSIDLNAVRLCFQVFLEGTEKGKFTVPLAPIVSDPIYDKSKSGIFIKIH